jgi:hypothetical protein
MNINWLVSLGPQLPSVMLFYQPHRGPLGAKLMECAPR